MKFTLAHIEKLELRKSTLQTNISGHPNPKSAEVAQMRFDLEITLNALSFALDNAEAGVIGSTGFCLHA